MFYIALCDDEWQAVEILTGYLSEIKRSGLQLESVPFLNGRELVHQYERGRKFEYHHIGHADEAIKWY